MHLDHRKLRALREAKGWTQERLAEEAGISQSFLAKLESGKALGKSRDTQDRLASALHVPLEALLFAPPVTGNVNVGKGSPGQASSDTGSIGRMGQAFSAREEPVERALLLAFDKVRHDFEDVDVVRALLAGSGLDPEQLQAAAAVLLDAAAYLRTQHQEPTAPALALRLALRLAAP